MVTSESRRELYVGPVAGNFTQLIHERKFTMGDSEILVDVYGTKAPDAADERRL
jgi:hypothetical protein